MAIVYLAVSLPARLFIFYSLGLYRRLWQHASVAELERILLAGVLAGFATVIIGVVLLPGVGALPSRVPLSVVGTDAILTFAVAGVLRLFSRLLWWRSNRLRSTRGRRVLVVGAGEAAQLTVREMIQSPQLGLYPIGFVDDDPHKQGHLLLDIPVLGTTAKVAELLAQYAVAEVVIAMPTAPGSLVRKVVKAAMEAGVEARTIPGLFEILSGRVGISSLRPVEIQDLLRRDPIQTELESIRTLASGRVVMVTGAGGSIGSELCRQLAPLDPELLILLGHGENSIFEIQQELATHCPRLKVKSVIADIRDEARINAVFAQYRPYAVFHAAAHKHVPLMEANVVEAITNNVLGTKNVVSAAAAHDTPHFVLVSTDKAVRPTSIMGATKRIAEQIVQLHAEALKRPYVSVRFGNVLGSRGSVIPTFLRQIQAGGPVTITHPDMTRYFMTIPEAVQLVLGAGAIGQCGEVFVLDMGEPVRILDLARDLIRLSGLQEGTDVEIRFTGCRPGEKLFEEMFFRGEHILPTEHPKVLRARSVELKDGVHEMIDTLLKIARSPGARDDQLLQHMRRLIPDFQTVTHDPPAQRTPTPTEKPHVPIPAAASIGSASPAQLILRSPR